MSNTNSEIHSDIFRRVGDYVVFVQKSFERLSIGDQYLVSCSRSQSVSPGSTGPCIIIVVVVKTSKTLEYFTNEYRM